MCPANTKAAGEGHGSRHDRSASVAMQVDFPGHSTASMDLPLRGYLEIACARFGTQRGDDNERYGDHSNGPGHDPRVVVAVRLGNSGLKRSHSRHGKVAELIGEARQDRAYRRRRQLVE